MQALLANRGTQAIDDIRTAIRNMIEEENRRLKNRSEEQTRRFYATMDLFGVVLLVNVALLAMLYLLQRRETERAREANEELERRVASAHGSSSALERRFAAVRLHRFARSERTITDDFELLDAIATPVLRTSGPRCRHVHWVHHGWRASDERADSGHPRVLPRRRRQ